MQRNQWLKIIPYFLCIFTLMALFLSFGKAVVNAPDIEALHGNSKSFTGWKAAFTTIYSWLMIAFPVLILLTKLVPDARRFEPLTSLILPGVHIVIMFVTFYNLRNVGFSSEMLGDSGKVDVHIGIGFILMLVCQLAMIVLRLMEMTARPAAPAKPAGGTDLVPAENERHPARR